MADISCRTVEPEDASAVTALGRAAFIRQYEGLVDPRNYLWAAEQWYSREAIEQLIAAADPGAASHFLVAERDGEVVGFLTYDEAGPEPELHRLYVNAARRGNGIGALLLGALHERLAPGAAYVLVAVEGNDRAVRFYERHGLEVVRRVSGHAYYRETAGIEFPSGARDFGLILMRRSRAS